MDMDNYNPVQEIRVHWADVIEQALECPVCLDIAYNVNIYICINGHSVCNTCKKSLDACPVCKSRMGNTRNRPLEHLANKFEEIKLSLLDPASERLKITHDIKTSVVVKETKSTQTDIADEKK